MTLHSSTENSLAVLNHKILEVNSQVQNVKLGGHQTCLSINRLWHELCDMLRRLVGTTAPGHHDCSQDCSWIRLFAKMVILCNLKSTSIEHGKVRMPVYPDDCPNHQTTSIIAVLFYNVRGQISTPGENTPKVLSILNNDSSLKKARPQSSFVQDRCLRHHNSR
ncbi:uncharacterized protein TNCV_827471 [Trichonephila clavipes]|nr:uncharacterized protein TNCV_827471 [Trichonephila clavipes]